MAAERHCFASRLIIKTLSKGAFGALWKSGGFPGTSYLPFSGEVSDQCVSLSLIDAGGFNRLHSLLIFYFPSS